MVATYQSVSGAGKDGMDELFAQTRASLVHDPVKPQEFTKQIAFNCIPHIDRFMEDGSTKEEWKMSVETRKILDPDIRLVATCVRVPVFIGHSEAVNVEFEGPISVPEARAAFRSMPGLRVMDTREDGGYATQLDCQGEDETYVSRIRKDSTVEHGAVVLGGERQSAERCGAERGADRRDADRAGDARQQGRLTAAASFAHVNLRVIHRRS